MPRRIIEYKRNKKYHAALIFQEINKQDIGFAIQSCNRKVKIESLSITKKGKDLEGRAGHFPLVNTGKASNDGTGSGVGDPKLSYQNNDDKKVF